MRAVLLFGLLAVAAIAPALAGPSAAEPASDLATAKQAAATKALAYLAGVAAGNGATGDGLVEAIEGLGIDPALWPTPANNVLDRLYIPLVGTTGNDPIREIQAYAQSGYPMDAGGRDLVADLRAAWDSSPQGIGQATFTALGLHAAGLPDSDATIQDAVSALRGGQATGGFWVCDAAVPPQDVDCTGFALTALAAVHALTPELGSLSKAFLDRSRNADGGYEEHPDPATPGPSNADSTVWAVNGYRALGEPEPEACWRFVLSRQQADGSFAWERPGEDDLKHIKRNFATKEVLANLWTSFADWPTWTPAPDAPATAHVDVPTALKAPAPFTAADWSADGPSSVSASGTSASLVLPEAGAWTLRIDARGPGAHSRARLPLQAVNDPPVFHRIDALDLQAGDTLDWTPQVTDPEGQPLAIAWTVAGESGTGAIRLGFPQPGAWQATVKATDPHGSSATLTVPVRVHPVAQGSSEPATEPVAQAVESPPPAASPGLDVEELATTLPLPAAYSPPATPAVAGSAVVLPTIGLHAGWSSHDGVVDVEAAADPAAYVMLSWCDAAGCHEEAVVEGHAYLPAGVELRDVLVRARVGTQEETASLGDILTLGEAPSAPLSEGTPAEASAVDAARSGWAMPLAVLGLVLGAVLAAVAVASVGRK
jgi:hypothetical protein